MSRSGNRFRLLSFILLNVVLLAYGCMPTDLDATETSGAFVVGGASGAAGPSEDTLAGGDPPGSFGTTNSVGIGGAGLTEVELGTGPGFPNEFRLLSVANGRLVQLLVNPPALVPIGAANLARTAIATAPSGTLFGLNTDLAGNTELVEISPTTGAVTPVGPVTEFTQVGAPTTTAAFAPTGTLFAAPGTILYGVNPITGQATAVLPSSTFGAFTFGPTGTLVGTTAAGLAEIDLATGVTTGVIASLGQVPFAPYIQGMTFAPDGFIYAVSDRYVGQADLVRIDPTTGVSVMLATYNASLYGLAVQPLQR
jgi:hypothetical protein